MMNSMTCRLFWIFFSSFFAFLFPFFLGSGIERLGKEGWRGGVCVWGAGEVTPVSLWACISLVARATTSGRVRQRGDGVYYKGWELGGRVGGCTREGADGEVNVCMHVSPPLELGHEQS